MEIRDLRYFLVLAEELHFGRASERLHIAQPALSQQLKRLERELGLVLVERSSRVVRLTSAGERFRREALDAVDGFDRMRATMGRIRDGLDGRLVLGISPGIRPELLQALVVALTRTTGSEITTRAASTQEAAHLLRHHEVDAALLHGRPGDADVAHRVIEHVPLGVAIPSGHRLARRRAIQPRDLTGETLIWVGRDAEPQLYDSVIVPLQEAGYEPGPMQHPPTVDTSLNLVAAGVGVSLKFKHELQQVSRIGVVWRPLAEVRVTVPTVLTWRRGDRAPLLSKLRQAARALSDLDSAPRLR